jgi:hypothetical protein
MKVKFIVKCLYGARGEEREVTERAAMQYANLGFIEKEEKEVAETKEEKIEVETKEEKPKKGKITKAPKL